jgi:hypothetical protein
MSASGHYCLDCVTAVEGCDTEAQAGGPRLHLVRFELPKCLQETVIMLGLGCLLPIVLFSVGAVGGAALGGQHGAVFGAIGGVVVGVILMIALAWGWERIIYRR